MSTRFLKVIFVLLLLVTFGEGGFYLGTLYQLNYSQSSEQSNKVNEPIYNEPIYIEKVYRPTSINPDELIYKDDKGATVSAKAAIQPNFLISMNKILEQPEGLLKNVKLAYKLSGSIINMRVNPSENNQAKTYVLTLKEPKTSAVFNYWISPAQQSDLKVYTYSLASGDKIASSFEKVKIGDSIEMEEDLDLITENATVRTLTIYIP